MAVFFLLNIPLKIIIMVHAPGIVITTVPTQHVMAGGIPGLVAVMGTWDVLLHGHAFPTLSVKGNLFVGMVAV
jgi:hypothetical protein